MGLLDYAIQTAGLSLWLMPHAFGEGMVKGVVGYALAVMALTQPWHQHW